MNNYTDFTILLFTDQPDLRFSVENIMLYLNRSIVLECPELNIPWFNEAVVNAKIASELKLLGTLMLIIK